MPFSFKGRPLTLDRAFDAVRSRARTYFVQPVIGTIPRMLWGNDAGFTGNLIGRYQLARAQRAFARAHGGPPSALAGALQLQELGYFPIRPQVPPEVLDELRRSYLQAIESDATSRWIGVGQFLHSARGVIDPARRLTGVGALLTPDIRATVESYYGSYFEVMHIRAWRTRHVPNVDTSADAYSNQWHADRDPISMLRLFVYLSNGVKRDTGAFRIHSIDSTRRIIAAGGYFHRTMILRQTRAALDDPARSFCFEGDFGDACLANVELCLHRAGVPRAGYDRDMLQFTLRPSTRPLRADWVSHLPAEA